MRKIEKPMLKPLKSVLSIAFTCITILCTPQNNSNDLIWEKAVAPGLIYRSELRQNPPLMVHALRVISSSPVVTFSPELAGRTVYEAKSDGRATVSKTASDTNAIATINADFFPYTGDPLGLMVRQNLLVSIPNPRRSIFAWGPTGAQFGFSKFTGSVTSEITGKSVDINGVNEECSENRVVLNTPDAGISKAKKGGTFTLILKVDGNRLAPTAQVGATVISTTSEGANMPIGPNVFTLVAQGTKISSLNTFKPNQRIKINVNTTGFDWEKYEHAVGGGPMLLKDGDLALDAENEGLDGDFSNNRHPRTAVGRTAEGDYWFVTVDGRQKMSVGATLEELAEIMKTLGCKDAMNLDGGGSTCLHLLGVNVNRPSDKEGERPVANVLSFFGPRIQPTTESLKIVVNPITGFRKMTNARVMDSKGREISNVEIIWSLQGAAWIDQGGQITTLEPGSVEVKAYVRGVVLSQKVALK